MNLKKPFTKNPFDSALYNLKSPDLTTYRLTINRTFKDPVVIRIDVKQNENTLTAIYPSAAGIAPKKEITKAISKEEVQEIRNYIEKMDFWNLIKDNNDGFLVMDGTKKVFEVYDKNKYHIIERTRPEVNKHYSKLINYLIDLTNFEIPKVNYKPGKENK
ncbi:MAG: hypothetical protein JXA99_04070 [Candidatus Lokiarchaeota archaeon]|nr:hypothetical protein [Candidatus Lokiarchaeota archaeon]